MFDRPGKREIMADADGNEHRRGLMSSAASRPTWISFAGTHRLLRWVLVIYVILLTYVLLAPEPFPWLDSPTTSPPTPLSVYLAWLKNDKVRHFLAYAILAGLTAAATRWKASTILIVAAAHGGMMEILQQYFPPRSMEWGDWFADVSGALALLAIQRILPRRRSD